MSDFKKIHKQFGQATTAQMETKIGEAHRWDSSYIDLIDNIVKKMFQHTGCPARNIFCLYSERRPRKIRRILSLDVVYVNEKQFLHGIGDETKWAKIDLLWPRRLQDQTDVFKRIQLYFHGLPNVIWGCQEFIKASFLQFWSTIDIKFVFVATNHYEETAFFEKANQCIWEHVNRKLCQNREPH